MLGNILDFTGAALPFVTAAIAIAIAAVYSNEGKTRQKGEKIEK